MEDQIILLLSGDKLASVIVQDEYCSCACIVLMSRRELLSSLPYIMRSDRIRRDIVSGSSLESLTDFDDEAVIISYTLTRKSADNVSKHRSFDKPTHPARTCRRKYRPSSTARSKHSHRILQRRRHCCLGWPARRCRCGLWALLMSYTRELVMHRSYCSNIG